jgi:hypothetical protein
MTQEQIAQMFVHHQAVPFQINLNGNPTLIGDPVPDTIEYFNVVGTQPTHVQPGQTPVVKAWLNEVMDNFTGTHATWNGMLIPADQLVKFT